MSRCYTRNGVKYRSVTTIIGDCTDSSGALTQWAANQTVEWIKENIKQEAQPKYKGCYIVNDLDLNRARFEFRHTSEAACNIGSEVHNAIEMNLQGKQFSLSTKKAHSSFKAFRKWKKKVSLKPIGLEIIVWGERSAGTLDFVGYLNGKLYIIDWKTSKAFYPEMRYQVAAYRNFYSRISGMVAEGCGVLRLDKETGKPFFQDTSKTYQSDLVVFYNMVDLFYSRHPKIRAEFEKAKYGKTGKQKGVENWNY